MFERFRSGCRLWQAYVNAFLREPFAAIGNPPYEFFEPTLSNDRRTATLPVGGAWTLGSRAKFENIASHLLREFLPDGFRGQLKEGLTESDPSDGQALITNWRSPTPTD